MLPRCSAAGRRSGGTSRPGGYAARVGLSACQVQALVDAGLLQPGASSRRTSSARSPTGFQRDALWLTRTGLRRPCSSPSATSRGRCRRLRQPRGDGVLLVPVRLAPLDRRGRARPEPGAAYPAAGTQLEQIADSVAEQYRAGAEPSASDLGALADAVATLARELTSFTPSSLSGRPDPGRPGDLEGPRRAASRHPTPAVPRTEPLEVHVPPPARVGVPPLRAGPRHIGHRVTFLRPVID